VSGAAALYIQRNPGATPDQVRLGLVGSGECPPGAAVLPSGPGCLGAWPDDPDTLGGPLVSTLGLWRRKFPRRTPTAPSLPRAGPIPLPRPGGGASRAADH